MLAKLPEIARATSRGLIGPYPFDAVGAIVDDAPDVGYALESQTKPNFDRAPDEATLAHELVHQWFGDSVTLARGPTSGSTRASPPTAEWLWDEHTGGPTAQARFDELYAAPAGDRRSGPSPPADPGGPRDLFSGPIYERGAMTLQALRAKVGDAAFFDDPAPLVRREPERQRRRTADFMALAERVSRTRPGHVLRRLAVPAGEAHDLVRRARGRGR